MKLNSRRSLAVITLITAVCGILVCVLWSRFAKTDRQDVQLTPSELAKHEPPTSEVKHRRSEQVRKVESDRDLTIEKKDGIAKKTKNDVLLPNDDINADGEEQLVDAFDSLTDRWLEPAAQKVTMEEVQRFREQFSKVPKSRRNECIHRALNLIPDENVMLLAGILFDTSQDRDTLEVVYNDILNRDEDVKKPILQTIFKNREHPCWADTAWILDVTGELPNKKGEDDK